MQTRPLAVLALTITAALVPGLAVAQCVHDNAPKITASACAEGTVWDTVQQECVTKPTS